MRAYALFFTCFCSICTTLFAQTTYFSNNSSPNFNTLSGWSLNANGTGANPPAFNTGIRLVVQNGHTKTTSGAVTINRLTIQAGATVTANNPITISGSSSRFEIENGGLYVHNNNGNLSSTIFNGVEAFGSSSTFQVNNWQSSTTALTTSSLTRSANATVDGNNYCYGNLIINWAGSGNWNQDWPSFPAATYLAAGDLTILSVGDLRFTQANNRLPDVYIAGHFIMNSTGAGTNRINFSSGNNCTGYINVNGNITHSNGTITASGNSQGFFWTYGSASSNWSFTGGSRPRTGYVIDGVKTVTLLSGLAMGDNISGPQLQIGFNSVLDAQQHTISTASAGTYIQNFGSIRTAHSMGLWTNGQTNRTISDANDLFVLSEADSEIEYYGASGQLVSSLSGLINTYDQYQNLTISGGNTKLAEGDITVDEVFNFTGAGNYLRVNANNITIGQSGSVSNAGANAYFILQPTTTTNGRLRQNNLPNSARVFPIGTASNYLPATITPSASGTDFSVSVFRGTTTNGSPAGTAFGSRTYQVDAVWMVDRAAGASNAVIRFDWINSGLEGAAFSATPNNQIGIWRFQSGGWMLTPNTPGPNFVANNASNNAFTGGAVANFGTAGTGLSYIVANINVLPGKLLSFTADAKPAENSLKWKVADPTQFKRYEVEVSKDGFSFSTIANVPSAQQQDYLFTDRVNTQQTVYYRLKMWDHFNQATYSNIVVVKRERSANMVLLQNPVRDQLIFRHPQAKNASFMIIDYTGKLYLKGTLPSGNIQTSLPVSTLPSGSYVLQFTDGAVQYAQKFIKW